MRFALAALLLPAVLTAANIGDVAATAHTGVLTEAPPPTQLLRFDASGHLLAREWESGIPLTTDRLLNVYLWKGNQLEVRDRFGTFVRTIPLPFVASTAAVVDASGNVYVMSSSGTVAKVAPDGAVLGTWALGAAYRLDLARDQCTLVYPRIGPYTLHRKDLCTDSPPVDLGRRANDVRILPDGRVLALWWSEIFVLSMDGRLHDGVTLPGFGLRMSVAHEEGSVWIREGSSGTLQRIRLSDGTLIARAAPPPGWRIGDYQFAVYGERRAANAPDIVPEVPALDLFAAALLAFALAFLAARQIA